MTPSNIITVDAISGSDSNPGTVVWPFKTIAKATAYIKGQGNNTQANPYFVRLNPGVYAENVSLLPWVWIAGPMSVKGTTGRPGTGQPMTAAATITGTVALDPSWASLSRGGLGFLIVQNSIVGNMQPAAANYCALDLFDCYIDAAVITWNDKFSTVNAVNCTILNMRILNGNNFFFGANADTGSFNFQSQVAGSAIQFIGCDLGPLTFQATAAGTVNLVGSTVLSVNADGAMAVNCDAISYPTAGAPTLTGGATFALSTIAPAISYTPGNPADWTSPPPANVQDAIDRLAAVVGIPH